MFCKIEMLLGSPAINSASYVLQVHLNLIYAILSLSIFLHRAWGNKLIISSLNTVSASHLGPGYAWQSDARLHRLYKHWIRYQSINQPCLYQLDWLAILRPLVWLFKSVSSSPQLILRNLKLETRQQSDTMILCCWVFGNPQAFPIGPEKTWWTEGSRHEKFPTGHRCLCPALWLRFASQASYDLKVRCISWNIAFQHCPYGRKLH